MIRTAKILIPIRVLGAILGYVIMQFFFLPSLLSC